MNSTPKQPKKRGRPTVGGVHAPIGVRMEASLIAEIDKWRRDQPDLPTRPEAIRQLVERALRGKRKL
jgi:metal-responsive CopG/Arc/MetJ family transcriptional regulator